MMIGTGAGKVDEKQQEVRSSESIDSCAPAHFDLSQAGLPIYVARALGSIGERSI